MPPDVIETIAEALVRGLRRNELSTAFANAITALVNEAELIDSGLASRLREPARELVRTASGPRGEPTEDAVQ